jgi:xylulokinase
VAAGTRVEVRDADTGALVAHGTARHPSPSRGQQPAEVWWDGLVDAVAAAGLRAEVAAMSVAGERQGLVLVDGAGAPLRPASLRTDARAQSAALEIVARLGADRLARATGQVPGTDTPLARLVWLLASDPGLAERVDAVLGAADVLTARLTGRRVTDRSGASTTGWWDPIAGDWRLDLLERAARPGPPGGWAAVLPDVLAPSAAADRVSATVHELVGLRGRPVVAPGLAEPMARALAAGVTSGTAAALLDDHDPVAVAGTATAAADTTGDVLGFADATGGFLPTVALAPVGRALTTVAGVLGTDAAGLAGRAAAAVTGGPADRGRVLVVAGVRDPAGRRPSARPGSVVGLDGDASAPEVARAALLGAAAEVVLALDLLGGVGGGEPDDGPLVLAGDVARHPGLAGAVADLAGREVLVARTAGAAAGACAQAAAALTGTPPLDVVRAWGLDAAEAVEPAGEVDAELLLATYAATRDALKEID